MAYYFIVGKLPTGYVPIPDNAHFSCQQLMTAMKVPLCLYEHYHLRDQDFLVKMITTIKWTAVIMCVHVIIRKDHMKFEVLTVVIMQPSIYLPLFFCNFSKCLPNHMVLSSKLEQPECLRVVCRNLVSTLARYQVSSLWFLMIFHRRLRNMPRWLLDQSMASSFHLLPIYRSSETLTYCSWMYPFSQVYRSISVVQYHYHVASIFFPYPVFFFQTPQTPQQKRI